MAQLGGLGDLPGIIQTRHGVNQESQDRIFTLEHPTVRSDTNGLESGRPKGVERFCFCGKIPQQTLVTFNFGQARYLPFCRRERLGGRIKHIKGGSQFAQRAIEPELKPTRGRYEMQFREPAGGWKFQPFLPNDQICKNFAQWQLHGMSGSDFFEEGGQ